MAVRDVRNFSFLKKAIEQRYRFRNDPNNISFTSFRGIPYEPLTNPSSIFGRIYITFRELTQTKHLVLNQYLNLGDKSVLERLYLNLARDPNLKFLNLPDAALNDPGYELSDQYYLGQPKEITSAQQAEQVPIGMPIATPISRVPMSAVPPATMPIAGPQPMPPAATATTAAIPPEQPQPQPKIGRPQIQVPRIPPSLANAAKSFGSRAGVLFQKYVGRYATAGLIATVVSGGIGAITGGALTNGSFLGIAGGGGLGAIAPSWIRSGEGGKFLGKVGNGAINVGTNLSNQITGGIPGSGVSVAKGRKGLVFLGALGIFFLIAIGVGLFGAMTGTTPIGETSPISSPGAILPSPGIATDCPIPNGTVTCGSQFTPINDCGHCGLNYPPDAISAYCSYPGTKYAIDIAGSDFQDILLPKINGNIVTWTYQGEEAGATQAIQKYTGSVSNGTYQTYYLQLHHTQPGSGNSGVHQSGNIGGKICGNGCNEGHVHVQVGDGGDTPSSTGWLDAAQYFCKK